MTHVVGYCLINDVSEREFQMERSQIWDKGKGFDTFGPIGLWLVTADEIGNTKTMIFDAATIVSYCSMLMTLEPGDITTMGTPPGVGLGKKPNPVLLKPGTVMTLGIEKLGETKQTVMKFKTAKA